MVFDRWLKRDTLHVLQRLNLHGRTDYLTEWRYIIIIEDEDYLKPGV